jgi:hypothetical protein
LNRSVLMQERHLQTLFNRVLLCFQVKEILIISAIRLYFRFSWKFYTRSCSKKWSNVYHFKRKLL